MYEGKQAKLRGVHDGDWPAIIDEKTFVRCVERRRVASTDEYIPRVSQHLLTGVAKCGGSCGGNGYVAARLKEGRRVYACYQGCVVIAEASVDAVVLKALAEKLSNDDWRYLVAVDTDALAKGEKVLALAQLEYEQLLAKARAKKISPTMAEALEPALLQAKEQAERDLKALTTPTVLHVLVDDNIPPFEVYQTLEIETQRKVLRELLTITLMPTTVRGLRPPDTERIVVE